MGKKPTSKRTGRPKKAKRDKMKKPGSIVAEPWRAKIYRRVAKEKFNGNFSEFARVALDYVAHKLGYPIPEPELPNAPSS
jgi:hypothetical protein